MLKRALQFFYHKCLQKYPDLHNGNGQTHVDVSPMTIGP